MMGIRVLVSTVALGVLAPALGAEECDLDQGDLLSFAIFYRAADLLSARSALTSPPSSHASAPADLSAEDPVPDASFPALLGISLGVPATTTDTGAVTLNLTPFALVTARHPDVIDNQSEYEKYESLRRVGAAITLGGKGEALDRDGDGTIDEALPAENWSDITSFELRYRFGSRDRRDRRNSEQFFTLTKGSFEIAAAALAEAGARVSGPLQAVPKQANGLYCMQDARVFASENATLLDPAVGPIEKHLSGREAVLERIDGAPIWTVVAGATERKERFGPDVWWIGVRGAGSLGADQGWSVSADFGETESIDGVDDARRIKVGVEWASLVAKRWVAREQGGIRASLSGAYEKWQNVPGTANDEIGSVNIKLTYPLSDTISIPLSVTWANKKALLEDESEVRGYIGFTFDFDGALRTALAANQ